MGFPFSGPGLARPCLRICSPPPLPTARTEEERGLCLPHRIRPHFRDVGWLLLLVVQESYEHRLSDSTSSPTASPSGRATMVTGTAPAPHRVSTAPSTPLALGPAAAAAPPAPSAPTRPCPWALLSSSMQQVFLNAASLPRCSKSSSMRQWHCRLDQSAQCGGFLYITDNTYNKHEVCARPFCMI